MYKSVDGAPLNIQFHRRRYGRSAFCWAYLVTANGVCIDLGDPWPAMSWPRSVLEPEAQCADAKHRQALAEAEGDVAGAAALLVVAEDAQKRSVEAQRALLELKEQTLKPQAA